MKRYPNQLKKEIVIRKETAQTLALKVLKKKNRFYTLNELIEKTYEKFKRVIKRRQMTDAMTKLIDKGLVEREYPNSGTYKLIRKPIKKKANKKIKKVK